MKTKVLFLLLSVLPLLFISCGEDDDDAVVATGISIDMDSLTVALEATGVLTATLEPTGAEGDITWSSSDPSVAAVNNGIVTALKVGKTTVVAAAGVFSASCEVTVTPKEIDPNDLPASLKGSNYSIIQIDETSYDFIKDKIDNDFRPDDTNKFLYVWENTFVAGTPAGLNFYGQTEGWVSLVVASVGWSGAGYNVGPGFGNIDMTDMYANPGDYVFHVGLKSAQTNSSYLFIFSDGTTEAKICIGSQDFVDDKTYPAYANFTRDNEWQSVEIPLTKLNELGVYYNQAFTDVNILAFLAGGTNGTTLDLDACFFYKKAK